MRTNKEIRVCPDTAKFGFAENDMQNIEIWDLYDKQRHLVGRDHIRGEKIPHGCYHLVVHVWIKNRNGEYLISQRSADRSMHSLKWECTGGSALKGEDSLTAALRETKEEIGLILSPSTGKIVTSVVGRIINGVHFSDIVDVWLFDYNGPVDLAKATTAEVAQIAWLNKEQIKCLFDDNEFVDTLGYFLESSTF